MLISKKLNKVYVFNLILKYNKTLIQIKNISISPSKKNPNLDNYVDKTTIIKESESSSDLETTRRQDEHNRYEEIARKVPNMGDRPRLVIKTTLNAKN